MRGFGFRLHQVINSAKRNLYAMNLTKRKLFITVIAEFILIVVLGLRDYNGRALGRNAIRSGLVSETAEMGLILKSINNGKIELATNLMMMEMSNNIVLLDASVFGKIAPDERKALNTVDLYRRLDSAKYQP